jgi:hypothetical protein
MPALTTPETPPPLTERQEDAFHRFLVVFRQALLLVNAWIERECGLERRR